MTALIGHDVDTFDGKVVNFCEGSGSEWYANVEGGHAGGDEEGLVVLGG